MTTKARELSSNPNGDRRACSICNPKPNRVRADRVWGEPRVGRWVKIVKEKR